MKKKNDIWFIIAVLYSQLYGFIKDNFSNIKITKLAKGLASGTDLEYSDFNTLSNAFENRTNIN